MNKLFLALIFTTTSAISVSAKEAQTITEQKAPEYQNYEQTNDQGDQLEKLLEIPEVKAVYDQCSTLKNGGANIEISECLWNGDVSGEIQGVGNISSIKDKIASKLNNLDNGKTKKYESINVLPTSKKQTESQKKLEEYYYKNMSEQIFGENTNGKNADGTFQIVDHSKFNTIYQNQLTKNILTAISSFCIEAELKGSGKAVFPILSSDSKERDKVRIKNVETLSKLSVGNSENSISGAQSQSNNWQTCFVNAQYVCHDGTFTWKDAEGEALQKTTAKEKLGVSDTCKKTEKECISLKEDYAYSKTRACELTNYLKVAKQNLKAVEIIADGYETLQKTGGTQITATSAKFEPKQNLIKEVSLTNKIDSITSVTSNEFINESGFSDGVNGDIAELESCIIKDPETGEYSLAPDAQEACKKYLNTNREEVEELKSEYALRLNGLVQKIEGIDKTSEDTKDLEGFLKDQGYNDEKIGYTIEANTDIKKLKEQIIERYKNEKLELIKSMNAKIEEKASSTADIIDVTTGSQDVEKLVKIHEELSSKTEHYAQLIHFNNVVAGFLDVTQGDKSKQKNTASIQREIANSAFSEENLQTNTNLAGKYAEQNENLEKSLEANQIDLSAKPEDNTDGATIGVDIINDEILKYDVDVNH